jgi:hypothetical protein
MQNEWIIDSLKLQLAGNFTAAAEILSRYCDVFPSAKIRLALIGENIGWDRDRCLALIAQVEQGGPYSDFETNFQLFKAYDAYMGSGEASEMPAKAMQYQEQAALAQDAPIEVMLAVLDRYKYGSSVGSADADAVKRWQLLIEGRRGRMSREM